MTVDDYPSTLFTMGFGLACAAAFVPLATGLGMVIYWPKAFSLSLWGFIALYALCLGKISRTPMRHILFPLILLLLAMYAVTSYIMVIVLCSCTLSVLRTGICYTGLRQFWVECLVFVFGTAALICFCPHTVFTWAVSIWLFFLIQAFYPLLVNLGRNREGMMTCHDFAQAERAVERLLAELQQSMTR